MFSDCPTVLIITLQNVPNLQKHHSNREGTYLRSDDKVNGHPYWNQEGEGKTHAIWYDKNYWIVSDESYLGTASAMLWNPNSDSLCPNIGNWNFFDWDTNEWIISNRNDIFFSTSGNSRFMSRERKNHNFF